MFSTVSKMKGIVFPFLHDDIRACFEEIYTKATMSEIHKIQ